MAHSVLTFDNPRTGQIRQAPIGFSWSTFFVGGFVPLYRGDTKWFFLCWLLALVTGGISWLVMPFLYNNIYARNLHNEGFIPRPA
jgi:hypothetical protein